MTIQARDRFTTHIRSARALLNIHQLLDSGSGTRAEPDLADQIGALVGAKHDEALILLINELFVGLVRERADLSAAFFKRDRLDLLLRQAIVAACSALDVFLPNLLETFLPTCIRITGRNFVSGDKEARQIMGDFRMKLDEVWPLVEELDAVQRREMISRRVITHVQAKTNANEQGVSGILALLGVSDGWAGISKLAGESEDSLRRRFRSAVNRRNDIVHRADRPAVNPNSEPTPIDFAWAYNHVTAVETVVEACCQLVEETLSDLIAESPIEFGGDLDPRIETARQAVVDLEFALETAREQELQATAALVGGEESAAGDEEQRLVDEANFARAAVEDAIQELGDARQSLGKLIAEVGLSTVDERQSGFAVPDTQTYPTDARRT